MSDAEIIAAFCEPKPPQRKLDEEAIDCLLVAALNGDMDTMKASPGGWWVWSITYENRDTPTIALRNWGREWLQAIWEVESKLIDHPPSDERGSALWASYGLRMGWHATAEQKIAALAEVLREEVEAR